MIGLTYRHVIKPILFQFDPERVHQTMVATGHWLGKWRGSRAIVRSLFSYQHPSLQQTIAGITFRNPIGLSAGFDKNAELVPTLEAVGFGFVEVGSITAQPCTGNPLPRLWRLPKSNSIVVHIGLANRGAEAIASKLEHQSSVLPVGISIAKTNCQETVDQSAGIADYCATAVRFRSIGQYDTLNVSCPNAFGGEPFHDPAALNALLTAYRQLNLTKPVFVKLSPDLDFTLVDLLVRIMLQHRVTGVICGNLTKDRSNPAIVDATVPASGGLSGKPTRERSLALIRHVYQTAGQHLVIIGVGGVFSAEDAYADIRAGASLVQLITGMIYRGPQLIGEINRGVVRLLQRDGYSNISQAIGRDR
ncbi:MAG: dihydroorotate dehydrogenase 2 [uncultured bacterium]|nr:MAG: dihydroorotate dehydrogenase 2 [uncultured bacterium]